MEFYISICAIFHNEAPYLNEWIEFHRKVGVDHFWLYNHLSGDHYKQVLHPYIEQGCVELIEWNEPYKDLTQWNMIQCAAYYYALARSKQRTRWLIAIDIDEFLFPVELETLTPLLKEYEEYSSIGVNWQMFGTSHVPLIQAGESLLEKLVWKAKEDDEDHNMVKCIVNPQHVLKYKDPHFPILKPHCLQVNPDKVVFQPAIAPYCSLDKMRINHYWTRDESYMLTTKMPRQCEWGETAFTFLEKAARLNAVQDTTIHRHCL